MNYLKSKHQRNSAKITTLIVLILLLLLFVVGPPYIDPPEEYGVAVNFGSSNFGSGNRQPVKKIKSQDVKLNKPAKETPVEETKPEPSKSIAKAPDVLTQDSEEAIALKKQKEAVAKQKAEAERKAREKAEAEAKKKKEQEAKKKKLDALMGGLENVDGEASGSEGNDNKVGDKGQLDGNPYATSYFGQSGTGSGGVGYGLNGRGAPSRKVFKQNCNESGLVVVRIEVDRNGKVIKAEPGVKGTKNNHPCLLSPAKKIALSHRWKPDPKAPTRQVGFVSINFKLGQ